MNAVNETLSMEGCAVFIPFLIPRRGKISDKPVYESAFMSGEKKDFTAWKQLPSGEYRLILSVRGRDGKEVSNADNAVNIVTVLAEKMNVRLCLWKLSFMKKYGVRCDSSGNLLFRHFHEGRIRPW